MTFHERSRVGQAQTLSTTTLDADRVPRAFMASRWTTIGRRLALGVAREGFGPAPSRLCRILRAVLRDCRRSSGIPCHDDRGHEAQRRIPVAGRRVDVGAARDERVDGARAPVTQARCSAVQPTLLRASIWEPASIRRRPRGLGRWQTAMQGNPAVAIGLVHLPAFNDDLSHTRQVAGDGRDDQQSGSSAGATVPEQRRARAALEGVARP